MAKSASRTCAHCKEKIHVTIGDVKDIVCYKNKFYHKKCFEEIALKRSQKSGKLGETWKEALENIEKYENEARERIDKCKPTDRLNDWLLDHYDIAATPSGRFWQIVDGIGKGEYKSKRCKPISPELLAEAWKWAQPNLDKINISNKTKNIVMEGESRIHYDLAIIMSKYPLFLKWKDRQNAKAAAAARDIQTTKINYDSISRQVEENKKNTNEIGDISDLLDELF